jgi:molybdopterin synthase catalytic subunit
MPRALFEVTTEPLSIDDVVARLVDPAIGGVGVFVGVVRGQTEGRETLYLEYEVYPEMAEMQLQRLGDEIRQRWRTIREVAIVHRVGRMEVGEVIVVIAVSAAHRRDLFRATQYAIDRLKEIVPIWKKEVWDGGEAWKSEQGMEGEARGK